MSFNDNSKELLISFLKNKQIDFENNFDLKKGPGLEREVFLKHILSLILMLI